MSAVSLRNNSKSVKTRCVRPPGRAPFHPVGQASDLQPREALEGERPAGAVSAQALRPLPVVRVQVAVGVQAETLEEGTPGRSATFTLELPSVRAAASVYAAVPVAPAVARPCTIPVADEVASVDRVPAYVTHLVRFCVLLTFPCQVGRPGCEDHHHPAQRNREPIVQRHMTSLAACEA